MVNERRWLVVIFSLYFFLAAGYSLLMPIWEAPDEPAHYHIAKHLARFGKYPSFKQNYEAYQPRPYYYFASWTIRALDQINPAFTTYALPKEYKQNIRVRERRFDWNDSNYRFLLGVYTLRWINILFGALALWFNWKAFRWIAPAKSTLQLSALALTSLTPQFLHIMSSVNNDALGTLAGAILFYLAVRVSAGSSSAITILSIALAFVLPFTTKLTVLPISAALLSLVSSKLIFKSLERRRLLIWGGAILIIAGLLYFVFPEILRSAQGEITWRLFSLRKNALTSKYITFISNQIIQTYWGYVGWLAVGLPNGVARWLTVLGATGMIFQVLRLIKAKSREPQLKAWIATFTIAAFTILAVTRNGLTTGATQGRLLFPAIGALSMLMISGWYAILPERYQQNLPLLVTISMAGYTLLLWFTGILPVYYQPFLD